MESLRRIKKIIISILCVVFMYISSQYAFAEEAQEDDITFYLTYPDGSSVSVSSIEEAEKLLDEWKLLYEGKTDPKGIIVLEDWNKEGEIKIVEKEIPVGYTAETTETVINLSEGEAEIVNTKEPEPLKEQPRKEETPKRYSVPKTGVVAGVEGFDAFIAAIVLYLIKKY